MLPSLSNIPQFEGPLLPVQLPELGMKRTIAVAPFVADLGNIPLGKHAAVITCFGNRENAFGCCI